MREIRDVSDLGPVRFVESSLASRVRFHQAWYRAAVLHVDSYGSSTHRGTTISRGSILPKWAVAHGMNFVSDEARVLYDSRRSEGWGLDPVRCQAHLTSSQALTLNLFGPLMHDRRWFARVLSLVLATSVTGVLAARVEHSPGRPSQALGDRTIVDLWLLLLLDCGDTVSVVFEVKYCDRFNSRFLPVWSNDRYRRLSSEQTDPTWDWDNPAIQSRTVNQLLRCHAMAEYLGQRSGSSDSRLVVLHHQSDQSAVRAVNEYSLIARTGTVLSRDLTAFLNAMRTTAVGLPQQCAVDALDVRYDAEDLSENLWNARTAATLGANCV